MLAVCWNGVNDLRVETVKDPEIRNPRDAIIAVKMSSVCGSDLHLISGCVPLMRPGDIIGHEFMGEVVETGPEVKRISKGDWVVVASLMGCGRCYFCEHQLWSLCDNSNPKHVLMEALWGHSIAGVFGYSHATGGFAGSHAQYIRVPFADTGAFKIPEGIPDDKAIFASDALPTGYMAAEMCKIKKGDVVAVWGAGGVGQMAIRSAYLFGAERVIAIDRVPERLTMAREKGGAEAINFDEVDVLAALKHMTGGRGPDACIDAVGMEAEGHGFEQAYDWVKQKLHLTTDRAVVLRQAITACRKGGTVSIAGVYIGVADKFPIGAVMNKALILRSGQQHGQRYIPRLLEHIARGELDPSDVLTHRLALADGPRGYAMFKARREGCVRVVFTP